MNSIRFDMNYRMCAAVTLVCLISVLMGCVVLKKGPVYVPLHHRNYPIPKMSPRPKAKSAKGHVARAALIQVMEINLPIGKFSRNPKIWKLLTPAPVGARTAKLLTANGFKAGEGTFADWPVIRKLINGPGVSSEAVYCQLANIAPAILTVNSNIRSELLTYHTAAEPLVVRTYRNCTDQFLAAANANVKLGLIILGLEPAITTIGTYSPRAAGALPVPTRGGSVRHVFSDMQFSFALRPEHFVVLAPAHVGVLNTSIGTCFLTQQNHVPRRETVLLLVPLATR
ncbi:MAG: hypothetical protein ACP5I8_12745 [Phycisphaerae bacterium]